MAIYPSRDRRKEPIASVNEPDDSAELKNALTQWDSLQDKESLRVEEIRNSIVSHPQMKEINSKMEELNTIVLKHLEAIEMLRSSRKNLEMELSEIKNKEFPSNNDQINALKVKIQSLRAKINRRETKSRDDLFYTQEDNKYYDEMLQQVQKVRSQLANTLKDPKIYRFDGSELKSAKIDEDGNILDI